MARHRVIKPEWLDILPPGDPRAMASRRDLRLINSMMRHRQFFARTLPSHFTIQPPKRLVEIGSGDGFFLLTLARRLVHYWPDIEVTLVDLQPVVGADTLQALSALGWAVRVEATDVFEWATRPETCDIVIANLFLHHFHDNRLKSLFQQISTRTQVFAACEPRRCSEALMASRLLGLIGCNDVTRHDGRASVEAGFNGNELSSLWPSNTGWRLDETRTGLFSHSFVASRARRTG